jgi:phosphoribosylformylglycinamidine (FGAM) synthase-like enzyme
MAECCFSSLGSDAVGATVDLKAGGLLTESVLFSESPSRIIVSFAAENVDAVAVIADDSPFAILGHVGDDILRISIDGNEMISSPIAELEAVWETSLEKHLESTAAASN